MNASCGGRTPVRFEDKVPERMCEQVTHRSGGEWPPPKVFRNGNQFHLSLWFEGFIRRQEDEIKAQRGLCQLSDTRVKRAGIFELEGC